MLVGDLAEDDALVHPEGVGGAQDQRRGGDEGEPEALLHRPHDDHELADEAAGRRQAGVGQGEEHHQGGEARHRVHDAAIVGDGARVHAVVHHADAEEQRRRDEAVRDHLHQRALDAIGIHDEEAEGDEPHVRYRRVGDQTLHVGLHQGHQADVGNRDER